MASGDRLPPSASRQQVSQQGNDVVIVLQKDNIPKRTPLGEAPAADNKVAQEALVPTPFIQSDAPELVAAAKKAIGGAKDVFSANTKLIQFVDKHMHKEYVPAYSNALEAFKTARGDCTEHSVLYVALARALNIPARVAVGIAYWAQAMVSAGMHGPRFGPAINGLPSIPPGTNPLPTLPISSWPMATPPSRHAS